MPDSLGNITVPTNAASGTWPLEVRFGSVRQLAPKVVIHTFGSANEKVEQRYKIGNGDRAFQLQYQRLSKASLETAEAFWRARKGMVQPFTFSYPLEEGGTASPTVRFADEVLSITRNVHGGGSLAVTLVEVPTTFPTYTVTTTLNRFPDATLATALLAQAQEIIPLIRIRPKLAPSQSYPDNIFLSDRRCTVAGQLYQARLLEWSGISQAIGGENDTARFVLGNADGVLELLAADVDLSDASIEFSLYHVGSQYRLDLWKGEISEFDPDESSQRFTISATDVAGALNEFCPQRVIDRACWKTFNDGTNCPYATINPSGIETTCDKSWAACTSRGMTNYFGGVMVQPQGVYIRDNASPGRPRFTATSMINDSIYGKAIPHVYADAFFSVPLLIASGREEGDYYAALGIVSEGPISSYNMDGLHHRLDGQPPHGPLPLGLRQSYGQDPVADNSPDPNSQFFSLGAGNPQTYDVFKAAGIAFVDIRRTDAKGQQLSKADSHSGTASVTGGMGGWKWTTTLGVTTRAFQLSMANPVWIAINEWLRTKQVFSGTAAQQEATFIVADAISAAAIASTFVPRVIGSGDEEQFRFRGVIAEQKPLKDQLQEILNNCLGYYYIANGKLRIGLRYNASAVEAFTAGNILADSLRLKRQGERTKFNQLSVQFADDEFSYQTNTVTSQNEDHRKRYAKRQAQQMNLLGTYTKSQAARISETRLREALGGISSTEWKKQRAVNIRTTILALAVEPGMVCSLTHLRSPGGAINFRVKRIVWNGDWSVDIEGDYVTASMYDLTVGPKPVDVGVTPAPVESVEAVPGDIQQIAGNAFSFTVSDVADSNGVKRKSIACTYDPPANLTIFAGVSAWLQTPGGVYPLGDADYNGDGTGTTPGRYGTAIFVAPPPAATESWKLYLVSRSRAYRKRLALSTDTTPSPYVTMSVAPVTAIGVGTPAENVSTVSATVSYNGDRWGLSVTVAFGASRANIAKAVVIVRGPTNFGVSVDRNAYEFVPPVSGSYTASIGGEWLRAGSAANFVVLVQTYNDRGDPTESPISSSTVTVNPVNSTTQATSTSVTVWKGYTADGLEVYGLVLGWTQANDTDTSHTEIYIEAYDSATSAYRKEQLYNQTGPGGGDNGFAISGRGSFIDAVPSASQNIRVTFYTLTKAGNRKPSAPQTVVAVTPGTGGLNLSRSDVATIGAGLAVSGGQLRVPAGGIGTTLLAALAVTANELATAAVTGPKVAAQAIGSAAIGLLAVDNSHIANATIQAAKIVSLNADKITAGTISAAVSITSPNITSTSGVGVVILTNGLVTSELGSGKATVGSGFFKAENTSTAIYASLSDAGLIVNRGSVNRLVANYNGSDMVLAIRNSAANLTFEVGSSNCDLTGIPLRMGGATVINTSGQFVGAGVDVGSNGVNAVGYNVNGGFFGQTSLSLQIVTDVRNNAGTTEKKTRVLDIRGGVVTSIGAESAWTPI